ncbi:hypothetical protein L195_g044637 [Trifolium pratense]|uniref:Uncharacterized protein n=1 Tax=Trifolium pratense TaxID=57577 RepID=A0A2K3MCK7_TRIPR|nr:hypothetical protein L195_g044637 [Trifolium pratense]
MANDTSIERTYYDHPGIFTSMLSLGSNPIKANFDTGFSIPKILYLLRHVTVSCARPTRAAPDIQLPTSTKPRIILEFFTLLVGVTLVTSMSLNVVAPSLDSKDLRSYFLPSSRFYHVLTTELLGPLRFSTVVPCLPYVTLS